MLKVLDSRLSSIRRAMATNLTTNDTSEFSNAKAVLAPTAASVSIGGRIVSPTGRSIFGAQIQMTDAGGNARYATTNPFGYYRFLEVAAGQNYIFDVRAKHFHFPAQVVSASEEIIQLNIVAEP